MADRDGENGVEETDAREDGEGDADALHIIVPGQEDVETLRRERDEYLRTAQRARADYVNLQRRMDSQFAAARQDARGQFALDMLDILDDLERALDHAREEQSAEGLLEGIELVRDKFLSTLSRYDIKRVEALGEKFDHDVHDAIAEQPTDEVAPGTVVAVAQTGYMMGDRLLRPARVVVSRPSDKKDSGGEDRGRKRGQ